MCEYTIRAAMLMRITALCVLASIALPTHAGNVLPPPRPPGSALIKMAPGQSTDETRKLIRAHRHKLKDKKDHTRDDSKREDSSGPQKKNPSSN
jgi:hypothetical protein